MERLLTKIRPQLVQLQQEHEKAFAENHKYDFYQKWADQCRELVAQIDRRDALHLRDLWNRDLGSQALEIIWNEVMNLFEVLDTLGIFDTLAELQPGSRMIIIERRPKRRRSEATSAEPVNQTQNDD